jgi:acetyl-CoA carboxylase carboxyl transferase subunit alpha
MLEYAIYSVISPEGCASILWRSSERTRDAAEMLRMTAQDMLELKIIDEAVAEPVGGAHRFPTETITAAGDSIGRHLTALEDEGATIDRRAGRRKKFLDIGRGL